MSVQAEQAPVEGAFLPPDDPEWGKALSHLRHDVYHLPGYVRACAQADGGEPVAYHARAGDVHFLVPLTLRPIPKDIAGQDGLRDLASPYGYGSPLCGSHDPTLLARFMAGLAQACRQAGAVSLFLRLHPLLGPGAAEMQGFGTMVEQGTTLYSDLTKDEAQLWSATSRDHRRGIKALKADGFQAVMDDWGWYDPFIEIYGQTMARVDAAKYYFFPHSYFENLRADLADRVHLCAVTARDGTLAAAGLFFEEDGIVQYHLSATAEGHVRSAPSKLMLDFVRSWARARGDRVLHFGMGQGGQQDSLFRFKQGFATNETSFLTLRLILDEPRYAALSEAWAQRAGRPPEGPAGFFPAYRLRVPARSP